VKYAWIAAHRDRFALNERCDVLAVRVGGYRAWPGGGTADRRGLTDAPLLALFNRAVVGGSLQPRITADLVTDALIMGWFRRQLNRFKNERVFGEHFATRDAMQATAFAYIEGFYNRTRRHSTLGYPSPMPFLKDWINPRQGEKQVA